MAIQSLREYQSVLDCLGEMEALAIDLDERLCAVKALKSGDRRGWEGVDLQRKRDRAVRKVAELRADLEAYTSWNPYVTFRPWDASAKFDTGLKVVKCAHPGQASLLREISGGRRCGLASGGNGAGKTTVECYLGWRFALGGPGRDVVLVGHSKKKMREQLMKELWLTRPSSELSGGAKPWTMERGLGKDPIIMIHRPEWNPDQFSHIIALTYEMGVDALSGYNLYALLLDEPPRSQNYLHEAEMRLRTTNGYLWVFATFIHRNRVYSYLTKPDGAYGAPVRLKTADNQSVDREFLRRQYETLPPDQIRARLEGDPIQVGGPFYWAFEDRRPWVVPRTELPDARTMRYYQAVDQHPTKPPNFILLGVTEDCAYVVKSMTGDGDMVDMALEWWQRILERELTEEEVDLFRSGEWMSWRPHEDERWRVPVWTIYDSPFKHEPHAVGLSTIEIWQRLLRAPFITSRRARHEHREREMNAIFTGSYNPVTRSPWGGTLKSPKPRLVIADECWDVIYQLVNCEKEIVRTEEGRERRGNLTGRKAKQNEDFTDLLDYLMFEFLSGTDASKSQRPAPRPKTTQERLLDQARRQMQARRAGDGGDRYEVPIVIAPGLSVDSAVELE